jgi:hypothetical protein
MKIEEGDEIKENSDVRIKGAGDNMNNIETMVREEGRERRDNICKLTEIFYPLIQLSFSD